MSQAKNSKLIIVSLLLAGIIIALAAFPEQVVNLTEKIKKRLTVFATVEIPYSFSSPRFPDRLKFLVSEIVVVREELEFIGATLISHLSECDCRNLRPICDFTLITGDKNKISISSGCVPPAAGPNLIGDYCPQRRQIEKHQFDLEVKTTQLSFLRRLLEKEMKISLPRELATLRKDDAQKLSDNLNVLLEQTQNIITNATETLRLSHSPESDRKCRAQCGIFGGNYRWQACVGFEGQQEPMTITFSASVLLKDLELGRVQIKNINLSLPDKITIPPLSELAPFSIPIAPLKINFPETPLGQVIDLTDRPVVFFPPSPEIPTLKTLELACPTLPNLSPAYEWATSTEAEKRWVELPDKLTQWSQEFDAIRTSCLSVLSYRHDGENQAYFSSPEYTSCHVPSQVKNTLEQMCLSLKNEYELCLRSATDISKCKPPPTQCNSIPDFDGRPPGSNIEPPLGNPLAPGSNIIGNFPKSILGCGASPPTIPKIRFPKIVIPDVKTPDFRLLPFLDIKLPDFIFEDLILPELELCNLNECSDLLPNFLPDLKFKFPSLDIPDIYIPSIPLGEICTFVPEAGNVCVNMPRVSMETLRYPSIPFPSHKLFNLGNLMTPELELTPIAFPMPSFQFALTDIDINLWNLLLGLLLKWLGVPELPTACLTTGSLGIPLRIGFDDVVFYWPTFPQPPEIPYCRQASQFCQRVVRKELRDVIDKVKTIQDHLNNVIQKNIQQPLIKAAQTINQEITDAIQKQLKERAREIEAKITNHIQQKTRVVAGKVQIEPLTIPMNPIDVPKIILKDKVDLPLLTIPISWPEHLKKISLSQPIIFPPPELPPLRIPLSKLSYHKDFKLKIPGLQLISPHISLGPASGACGPDPEGTRGDNPYPINQINSSFGGVRNSKNQIEQASQNIIDILR